MIRLTGSLEDSVCRMINDASEAMTPKQVQERLKTHKKLAYTTVMTVLNRLFQKGLLNRKKQGNAYAYFATSVTSQKDEQNELKNIFDQLISSYGNLAVSNFIDSVKTHPDQKKMLEDYLKNAKK